MDLARTSSPSKAISYRFGKRLRFLASDIVPTVGAMAGVPLELSLLSIGKKFEKTVCNSFVAQ